MTTEPTPTPTGRDRVADVAGRDNVRRRTTSQRPQQQGPPPGAIDAMGPVAELGLVIAELHRITRDQAAQIAQLLAERQEIAELRDQLEELARSSAESRGEGAADS